MTPTGKLLPTQRVNNNMFDALVLIGTGAEPSYPSALALQTRGLVVELEGVFTLTEEGQGALLMIRSLAQMHPDAAMRAIVRARERLGVPSAWETKQALRQHAARARKQTP